MFAFPETRKHPMCVSFVCVYVCAWAYAFGLHYLSRVYMAVCTASGFMRSKYDDMRQGGLPLNILKDLVGSFVVISFFHL